jgi:hypothetical protein
MKAIHALERNERFHAVRNFAGLPVRIVWDGLRQKSTATTLEGVLLSVATSNLGTGTELAIVRPFPGGGWDQAVSLATIFSVEELEDDELEQARARARSAS